jgi:hypothetical protein
MTEVLRTIRVICCFVLISIKWVKLDIFNNKWDYKQYLKAAKRKNILEGVEFEKNLITLNKSKRDQTVVLHDVLIETFRLTFTENR